VGVHFQVVAYKELTTFPSEWEVWKRLFQGVVAKGIKVHFKVNERCGRDFFKVL
jgi:hypothetical protein